MSETNNSDFAFTFGNIRKALTERLNTHRTQATESHKYLEDMQSTVDRNMQRIRSEQNLNADPLASEAPVFIANLAKEKGMTIEDLVSKSSPQEAEATHAKGQTQEEKESVEVVKDTTPLLDKKKVRGLADELKSRVFGQDTTIEEVVDVLTVAALDIKVNEEKPAGCYFFAGPSGVGKTELAQSIADKLGVPLIKINMGEYSQEQDVSKLIGASSGLVGYKEGGILTNAVKKTPKCVVLFDEIEKADPSMDNILLSIMDHGTCGDNKGEIVSFKETIVIATSNLGAQVEYYPDLSKEEKDTLRMGFIKEGLRPEIINRYDSIFHFNALTPNIYKQVANKFFKKLSASMIEKHGFDVKFTPKLIDFMVDKSYDPAMGGRPARRFIEKIIIKPLARNMLEDEFEQIAKDNKEITLDLNKNNNVCFKGKNKKILGILENTAELVAEFEAGKFTNKKSSGMKP